MTPSLRVLFVTHNIPRFTGDVAGSFVLRLATALRTHDVAVDVIAPGGAGLAARETLDGIPIARVRYAADADMTLAYGGTMAEAVRGSWRARWTFVQLLRALRRETRHAIDAARRDGTPYDLVHVHWWFPAGLALWRAVRAGRPPVVITMHGSDVRLAEHLTPAHPIMRAVLGGAAAVTAVSSWLADTAQRIVRRDVSVSPIEVAPMPVDATQLLAGADDPAAPRRGVLFVGRLNAQKGLRDLLDAMARTPRGADRAWSQLPLHVVGDGPDRDALRAHAASLGLGDRITWEGTLAPHEVAARYRAAQVVVMPSRGEGLGLVAVEAQLCGTPVVAYADGGLLDAVRPEHGGTLVTPGDCEALAGAIAHVTGDAHLARRLGESAREFVRARFTPDAVAHRYLDIYRDALLAGDQR